MKSNDPHILLHIRLDQKTVAIPPHQIMVQKTSPSQQQISANKDLETNKRNSGNNSPFPMNPTLGETAM